VTYDRYQATQRFFCAPLGLYFPAGAELRYYPANHAAAVFGVPRPVNASGSVSFDEAQFLPGEIDGWFREPAKSRFFVFVGTGDDSQSSQSVLTVRMIDEHAGTITLVNPTVNQIEVWKYTRLGMAEDHERHTPPKVYPPHIGKRYKRFAQLPMGATSWTIPDLWYRSTRRNYFKFALRLSDALSSPLTQETIVTAMAKERPPLKVGGAKIFLMRQG